MTTNNVEYYKASMCRIKLPVIHAFVVLSMILWCVDSQQFSPDGIDLHPLLSFFLFEFIFLCVVYVVKLFEIGASSLSSQANVRQESGVESLDQECGNTCRGACSAHTPILLPSDWCGMCSVWPAWIVL